MLGPRACSSGNSIAYLPTMSRITVQSYMSSFPHAVGPEHSMSAAHRLMRRHDIRHLPVLDEGKLVGVVSQRDLYFLESLDDVSPESVNVAEAMHDDAIAVAPTASLAEATKTMIETKAGSLIVMEGEKVTGIFTTIDALRALAELTDLSDEILASGR